MVIFHSYVSLPGRVSVVSCLALRQRAVLRLSELQWGIADTPEAAPVGQSWGRINEVNYANHGKPNNLLLIYG